jgi:hypothetical protein
LAQRISIVEQQINIKSPTDWYRIINTNWYSGMHCAWKAKLLAARHGLWIGPASRIDFTDCR